MHLPGTGGAGSYVSSSRDASTLREADPGHFDDHGHFDHGVPYNARKAARRTTLNPEP